MMEHLLSIKIKSLSRLTDLAHSLTASTVLRPMMRIGTSPFAQLTMLDVVRSLIFFRCVDYSIKTEKTSMIIRTAVIA